MAAAKGGAKNAGKDKNKGPVKKKARKLSSLYNISGNKLERKNRTCPKCGPGMFMGSHSNRMVCGKCSYVEFVRK